MEPAVYARMAAQEAEHWWFAGRRAILAAEIARLGLPAGARILEVGCGTGGNLDMLAAFGDVTAVEPDDGARARANARKVATVVDGRLPESLPSTPESFDLICAFDVIEHVEDDRSAVAALADRLAPGGFLVATVPGHAWMWSGHDAEHHHKRRYAMTEFRQLFQGLELRRATWFNTLLFPPIAALRLLGRALGREGGDDGLPPPPINGLLRAVFAAEAGLLTATNLPFGVSILLIARKPA